MRYQAIVFLQGEEAEKVLNMLSCQHDEKYTMMYLKQWDYGDNPEIDYNPLGKADQIYKDSDGYIISCNTELCYIGLYKEVEEE